MSRKIAIVIPHQAQLSSVAMPTDLLQLANRFACERTGLAGDALTTRRGAAPLYCRWISPDGTAARLSCGSVLPVDGGLAGDERYDAVFIGAFDADNDDALDDSLRASAPLSAWLRTQHAGGALIAACGTGVFLLAESGLLDGRPATAPWWLSERFHRRYAAVHLDATQRWTESGGLLCAGSLAGLQPLALRVVQRMTSPNTADWLAKTTLIDAGADADSPHAAIGAIDDPGDALVAAAQYQLQQRYAEKALIAGLARTLAVSPRTLVRRFQAALGMSPQAYVQQLRIDAAKRMLLRTSLRVERIGHQVGYGDIGFFKRLFRLQTGMTPAAWRISNRNMEHDDVRQA
ncbi:MAG: GlxA family transcriptional regulator [Solimonas sp.]